MSIPALASAPKTGWTAVAPRPATPTVSNPTSTTRVFTVRHMTHEEVDGLTSQINTMSLGQRNITEGQSLQAAGHARVIAAQALADEGRAQAAAANARISDAKTAMIAQLDKFKESVRTLHRHVKAADTQSPAKINALIDKISSFQANLPNNPTECSTTYANLRAEAKAIQQAL